MVAAEAVVVAEQNYVDMQAREEEILLQYHSDIITFSFVHVSTQYLF